MTQRKAPPKDLGKAGAAAWRSLTSRFEFHEGELQTLRQMCAVLDEIDVMEKALAESRPLIKGSRGQQVLNPLYNQLATHRTLVDRLMLSLALPADGEQVGKRRSPQQKAAANARWKPEARRGRGRLPSVAGGAVDGSR
jgi:hypothetical protein